MDKELCPLFSLDVIYIHILILLAVDRRWTQVLDE